MNMVFPALKPKQLSGEHLNYKIPGFKLCRFLSELKDIAQVQYRVFLHDIMAAMLVSLNKGMAAMLVSSTNPLGIELYSYANVLFCFR